MGMAPSPTLSNDHGQGGLADAGTRQISPSPILGVSPSLIPYVHRTLVQQHRAPISVTTYPETETAM
jgi:hypothetical protein